MDLRKLADRAKAELNPLSAGLNLRAALFAAETAELGPDMLAALLAHELVTGHATMMKLSTKLDRWLALMSDDRLPEDQDRGARESVRLAVAASRLSERYRAGVLSLARLKGWNGFAAARRRQALDAALADRDDDDPDGPDGGPGGGTRAMLKALKQLEAVQRSSGGAFSNGHAKPNGKENPHPNLTLRSRREAASRRVGRAPGGGLGAGSDSSTSPRSNRGKLRHGNPSGDFLAAPRCGARTRAACPCRQPAMANGRCRLHGGKSTGARTESGLARVRANRLAHGARSAEIIDLRAAAARHGKTLRTLARLAKASTNPQSERSTPCPATVVPPGGNADIRNAGAEMRLFRADLLPDQRRGLVRQAAGQVGGETLRQPGMRPAPDRDCRLQPPRPGLGQPHRPAPQIGLDRGDLDQPLALERAQIARQRRLLEARALGQRAQRVVG